MHGRATFGPTTLANCSYSGNVFVATLRNTGLLTSRHQVAGAAPLAVFPTPTMAGTIATLRLPTAAIAALPVTMRDALGHVAARATMPACCQELTLPTAGLTPGLYQVEAGLSHAQMPLLL
ncbi:hypothetical protein J4E00_04195 [Siccationidurans soli]|uniref:T9SS type A sorting domain-containing protein n=1 Tax=Hymenobacter negativus TaxID=2795026 RepID=A0ABS3QAF8_9BACT|nr:hypothetical protein [Hymenobacter negativus]